MTRSISCLLTLHKKKQIEECLVSQRKLLNEHEERKS